MDSIIRYLILIYQKTDVELEQLKKSTDTSLQLRDVESGILGQDLKIYCDTARNCIHPYIPSAFPKAVFDSIHGLLHPGPKVTAKLIAKRFM